MSKTVKLSEKLAGLLAKRDALRSEADASTEQKHIESLRTQIVAGKKLGADVSALVAERDRLQVAQRGAVTAVGAEISATRREIRRQADSENAKAFSDQTDDELAQRLADATDDRRAAKLVQRAVRLVMSSRAPAAKVKALAAQLSAEERKALADELSRR